MMKNYVVYNEAGEITNHGRCPAGDVEIQARQPGETAVEGLVDDPELYIVDCDRRVIVRKPAIEIDEIRAHRVEKSQRAAVAARQEAERLDYHNRFVALEARVTALENRQAAEGAKPDGQSG